MGRYLIGAVCILAMGIVGSSGYSILDRARG